MHCVWHIRSLGGRVIRQATVEPFVGPLSFVHECLCQTHHRHQQTFVIIIYTIITRSVHIKQFICACLNYNQSAALEIAQNGGEISPSHSGWIK